MISLNTSPQEASLSLHVPSEQQNVPPGHVPPALHPGVHVKLPDRKDRVSSNRQGMIQKRENPHVHIQSYIYPTLMVFDDASLNWLKAMSGRMHEETADVQT